MAEPLVVSDRLLRRAERLSLRLRRPGRGMTTGEHRGRGQTSSIELSDHRAYAPGDDFRRVDWNAVARLDTFNVKLSDAQQNLTLHVLIDRSASMEFGTPSKSRLSEQIAACLAYIALAQLDAVRVYGVSGTRLAGSPRYWGKGQSSDALRQVQSLGAGSTTDLAAALSAFTAGHPETGMLVLLSDLLSPTELRSGLRQVTAAGFEVVILHILSPAELHPSLAGNFELVDAETGARRRIAATPAALDAYQRNLTAWRAAIVEDCRAANARYVPLTSDQPIDRVLLSDLRRHGLVE
ncbi:MAG TPA: DUF58 domain-containing protein [Chloroflexota bacterium]|nr:DUF58 domain-containing protein [Chloroflexota bacterium]